MATVPTAYPPVKGDRDIELGSISNTRNEAVIFNPTNNRLEGETFDIFKSDVVSVSEGLGNSHWRLSKLIEGLDVVKYFPWDERIRFEDLELYLVKYSNSQGRNIVSTLRPNSVSSLIHPLQPVPEGGDAQDISDTLPQIVLFASPANVKVKWTTIAEKLKYPVTPDVIRRLPMNFLLGFLVLKWEIPSLDFSPTESPIATDMLNDRRLPPFSSDIQLPSKHFSHEVKLAKSQHRITWFQNAPSLWFQNVPWLLRYIKPLAKQDCYSHRPDITSVSIHIVPGEPQIWKVLFMFSSAESVRDFSARLEDDNNRDPIEAIKISSTLSMHLLSQVLDDGSCFLKEASERIDETKYKAIRSPQRLDVEYLMLLEDYLRQLPSILDKAIENIGELSPEHRNNGPGWCDGMKGDIEYLKKISMTLEKEANSVKTTIISHISILETVQMAKLTVLASVFVPLSFTTSFFGMNLQPISIGSHPLGLRLFWKVGIPLTLGTMVLPFLIGPIIRLLIGMKVQNQSKLILATVTMIVGSIGWWYVNYLAFFTFLGLLTWILTGFMLNLKGRLRTQDFCAIVKEFFVITGFLGVLLLGKVVARKWSVTGGFVVYLLMLASMLGYQLVPEFNIKELWSKLKKKRE